MLALLRETIDEGGRTLVMVTHDPSAAAWADRVVFMADGRLAGELAAPTAEQVAERLTGAGGLTMLRISWQTLRARRATLAGAFVAIWLAVTLAYATGLLMAGALSPPGAGPLRRRRRGRPRRPDRHARAATPSASTSSPAPRLPRRRSTRAAAVPGVARAVGDVAFPAGAWDARRRAPPAERLTGHGWAERGADAVPAAPPAARPAGRATSSPTRGSARASARPCASSRPGGDAHVPRQRRRRRAARRSEPGRAVLRPAVAARCPARPDTSTRSASSPRPARRPAALRARLRLGAASRCSTAATPPTPTPATRPPPTATALIAIFGALGGIAGAVALFVVAGTFALAIAQRRRETAVLRALGATPRQVRRLIAGEALIVSLVARRSALAGRAGRWRDAIVDVLADHGVAPGGFAPVRLVDPARRRARRSASRSRSSPSSPPRAAPAASARPRRCARSRSSTRARASCQRPRRRALPRRRRRDVDRSSPASGRMAFAVLGGILLATGTGLLGRWLLGLPAAVLALAAARCSARRACSRAPASRPTAGARPRSRRRSCSSRCSPARRASCSPATSATPSG